MALLRICEFLLSRKQEMATMRSISSVAGREPSRLGLEDIFQLVRDGNAMQVRVWLDNVMDDLKQGDDHGHSLLHWACKEGHTNIVDMLIARGARILQTNLGDDTPLHLAASHGHRDIVQRLIKNGADVNFVNEHGNTPLHYACFWRFEDIAEDLIVAGANVMMCNKYGDTPLDKCKQPDMRQALQNLAQDHGQDVESRIPYKDQSWLATRTRTRDATLSRSTHGIDLKHLSLGTKLGSSPNGESWKGRLHQSEVVAKILRVREVTPRVPRDFQDEAPRLRIFSHPNVLPVIAYNAVAPNLVLVSEYMPLGSLYDVLHVSSRNIVVDQAQCLRFALDVARGMSFLHALSPALPKLALNSKHVMVDEDLTGRINLADVEFPFQNRAKIYDPAWAAPEALNKAPNVINVKAADMWSYAVLLWELMTREVPFAEFTESPMVLGMKIALEGLRLQMAPGISAQVSRLILICMNENPGKRPTFDQIISIMEKMYNRVAVEQNKTASGGGAASELEREAVSIGRDSNRSGVASLRQSRGGFVDGRGDDERVRAATPDRGDASARVGKPGVEYRPLDAE